MKTIDEQIRARFQAYQLLFSIRMDTRPNLIASAARMARRKEFTNKVKMLFLPTALRNWLM